MQGHPDVDGGLPVIHVHALRVVAGGARILFFIRAHVVIVRARESHPWIVVGPEDGFMPKRVVL